MIPPTNVSGFLTNGRPGVRWTPAPGALRHGVEVCLEARGTWQWRAGGGTKALGDLGPTASQYVEPDSFDNGVPSTEKTGGPRRYRVRALGPDGWSPPSDAVAVDPDTWGGPLSKPILPERTAYVSDESLVYEVQVSAQAQLQLVRSLLVPKTNTSTRIGPLCRYGNYVLAAEYDTLSSVVGALHVLDFVGLREVGMVPHPALLAATHIAQHGVYAVVCSQKAGSGQGAVTFVNLADPTKPFVAAVTPPPPIEAWMNHPLRAVSDGEFVWVAVNGGQYVTQIDARDIAALRVVRAMKTEAIGEGPTALAVDPARRLLLVAHDGGGEQSGEHAGALVVVDIRNPADPVTLGCIPDPALWQSSTLLRLGDMAYVVSPTRGKVTKIDVSDPRAPRIVGICPIGAPNTAGSGLVQLGYNRLLAAVGGVVTTIDTGPMMAGPAPLVLPGVWDALT